VVAALCLVVIVGALILDAVTRDRSPHNLRAQFHVLLLVVALVGGITDVLPFGPTSDGMRLSLWLVPIFAIGAARALTYCRDAITRQAATVIFDAIAIIAAAVIILNATTDSPTYPQTGARSATNAIEQRLTPSSVVFVEHVAGMYPYAVATHLHAALQPRRSKVAFMPSFADPRIHYLAATGPTGTDMLLTSPQDKRHQHDVLDVTTNANQVFLYLIAPNKLIKRGTGTFAALMRTLGFGPFQTPRFHNALVLTWNRTP
jgi:hypothetical protein